MWKILSRTRTTDQAQEEDSHPGEGEEGEDPETHESQPKRPVLLLSVSWKALKGAQIPRRTSQEFSKRKL
jgi:hypothetical protein